MNKIKLGMVSGLGAVASLLGVLSAHASTMSTTTLGTAIDSTNGTVYDYFLVLLDKYWPFLVGFGILVGVWGFGKRVITHFS